MSLKAGTPRKDGNKYFLDDFELIDSMALEIEKEMKKVYKALKGTKLPEVGEEDRRILFMAIARGVLKYLDDNANELIKNITITHTTGTAVGHNVNNLDLDIEVKNLPV